MLVGAFRDRDRDGLLVFFVRVVLLGAAAAVYLGTFFLMVASVVEQAGLAAITSPIDNLRAAVATLEEIGPIARRVLGGAHPHTEGMEGELQNARAALRTRETPPTSAQMNFRG